MGNTHKTEFKKRLLIVGGGSAGWITAAYLNGALNARGAEKNVEITLIESPDIPRISVGEATIPSIGHILSVIGLDEMEFMKATEATFKQSIKYVNWLHNDGSFYHHPFSRYRAGPIDRSAQDWIGTNRGIPFTETVSAQVQICEMGLAPQMLGQWDFGARLKYAFHMNAQKFADYLRDFSVERGVKHIQANVTKTNVGKNGHIRSVETDHETELSADLFVDCTGFSAHLIEKALGVGFEDCSQFLFCDRAAVMQIPYEDYFPSQVRPYTTATAQSAGWIWDIPMSTRRSIGYVHSSSFISKDQAEREVHAYEGKHAEKYPIRFVNFKVGRRKQSWKGNCIAIGLSGGFIEPLESTGIYLADLASVMLAEHFPFTDNSMDAMAFRFNRIMSNRFYEILDFINMHYCLTRRTDTEFWKTVQRPEHITDRLAAKLEFWKLKLPSSADFEDQFFPGQSMTSSVAAADGRPAVDTAGLWNHESYEAILYGMDFRGPEFKTLLGDKRPPSRMPEFMIQRLQGARQKLPPHHIWLNRVLGMKPYEMHPPPPGWSA
ncbi:MAG: tryptophan halogenase [Robiginitomaculum sp.]|nr:MAG: tryptophan halogenase [Robiginitomaculum sp.]